MDWMSPAGTEVGDAVLAPAALVGAADAISGDISSSLDAGSLSASDDSLDNLLLSDSDSDNGGPILDAPPDSDTCDGSCWQRIKPARGSPVKRTGAWYYYHRQCPILPGHQTTVMQACFSMCMLKDQHRVPDVVVDKLCGYIHHVLLPPENKFPSSYHLMKAVAAVPAGSSTASDLCDKCWRVYPQPSPDLPPPPTDDSCLTCGAPRFKESQNGCRVPRRQMYNFGAEQTVVDLITKPGMVEAILDSRRDSWTQQHSFWGSPAGKALDAACGGVFQLHGPVGEIPAVLAIAFTLGTSSWFRRMHRPLAAGLHLQSNAVIPYTICGVPPCCSTACKVGLRTV